ncbi:hypothetical protein FKP32DRAFT_231413 [Trametes sanguinea]|nr:hypothetical protein FKP32DRAFT_231413 [Trametes sanguinea]
MVALALSVPTGCGIPRRLTRWECARGSLECPSPGLEKNRRRRRAASVILVPLEARQIKTYLDVHHGTIKAVPGEFLWLHERHPRVRARAEPSLGSSHERWDLNAGSGRAERTASREGVHAGHHQVCIIAPTLQSRCRAAKSGPRLPVWTSTLHDMHRARRRPNDYKQLK